MAQSDRLILEFQMRNCGPLAQAGMRRLELDELRNMGGAVYVFDGTSVFVRFQGEDPRRNLWDAFRRLKPEGGCSYQVFRDGNVHAIENGEFGLQDDIPRAYRPADA